MVAIAQKEFPTLARNSHTGMRCVPRCWRAVTSGGADDVAHRQADERRRRANSVAPEGLALFAAWPRRSLLAVARTATRLAPNQAAKSASAAHVGVRITG